MKIKLIASTFLLMLASVGIVSADTVKFANPLGDDVTTIDTLLTSILTNLGGIIASIAIIFIVIGGFMYILSAGDEKKITQAKATITAALIGLAIVLAAPTFLQEIMKILGSTETVSGASDLETIVTNVLTLLLSIVGIVAMIGLVIGGSFYFTAYGDDKRIETGKKIITNSLIGIVVVMAALILVRQLATLLGVA